MFSPKATLLEATDLRDRLHRCVAEAKRFLDTTSAHDLLGAIFDQGTGAGLIEAVTHIDHVGFLVPSESTREIIGEAASAAGLPDGHTAFRSMILARELGALLGRHDVPTTIFKACEARGTPATKYVEIFVPDADPETVRRWIAGEVGNHFGFALRSASFFEEATRLFEQRGFRVPPFMNGKPMTNTSGGVTVLYFDGAIMGQPTRVELVHIAKPGP
jgi:hypothetical protein